MHGRVKVRTSAQEQEAKRKEREKKLQAYNAGVARVFKKRLDGELDDELLMLTSHLLVSNPDIYTLWNIRRQVLQLYKSVMSSEDLGALLEKEVYLTEQCLRTNPKSYGAWFHRGWAVDQHPTPDWRKELVLCTKFLLYDERNLVLICIVHCWDYRRLAVERSQATPEDEFLFSTVKIEDNFSNYSAWHYRSKLLPVIHPDPQGLCPISPDQHRKELAMVQSAAFTDPNDTSAWFYQRWLLGRDCSIQQRPRAAPCLAWMEMTANTGLVAFSEPSPQAPRLMLGDTELFGTWQQASPHVWVLKGQQWPTEFTDETNMRVETLASGCLQLSLVPEQDRCFWAKPILCNSSGNHSANVSSELDTQLASCEQLLELEPDSKWTLLTSVLLMQAIDSKKYKDAVLSALDKLPMMDPLRKGYYSDLRSKYLLELQLPSLLSESEAPVLSVSLCGLQLSALYYMHLLALTQEVNLSYNKITERCLPALASLQRCTKLVLDHNKLTSLKNLPNLPSLCSLSICNNELRAELGLILSQLHNASLCSLYELKLDGNPCQNLPELQQLICNLAKRK